MSDLIMYTLNRPRLRRSMVEDMQARYCVRVYRATPGDVVLQIRIKGVYATVSLTFAEARQLAARLLAETTDIEGGE